MSIGGTLLNEMDGFASANDIIFVLTTNRVEVLEPALASRPGRIDFAVEMPLPDADSRRKLFGLYLGPDNTPDDLDEVVSLTEGVPASQIKELARQARFAAIEDHDGAPVTQAMLVQAIAHMLEFSVKPSDAPHGFPPDFGPSPYV